MPRRALPAVLSADGYSLLDRQIFIFPPFRSDAPRRHSSCPGRYQQNGRNLQAPASLRCRTGQLVVALEPPPSSAGRACRFLAGNSMMA